MSLISEIAPHAQLIQQKYNILASLIIAQAILESNWGQSGLATKGKNLFGVKGAYQGASVTMNTREEIKGKSVYVKGGFRKYPSWYESMEDLAKLYLNGVSWDKNKYRKVVGEFDYKKACQAVQAAGYATDSQYANKLIHVIQAYNLTAYDGKEIPASVNAVSNNVPMWNGTPLKKGQIGRLTILKPINVYERQGANLKTVGVLPVGKTCRVYGYDENHGGQYNVGGGQYVTNMEGYIKYETPSRALLDNAKDYYK